MRISLALQFYLWVGLGGALGTLARYGLSGLVAVQFGETFPWGTLAVNVLGSFVIGFAAVLTAPDGRLFVGPTARQFVMTGICGGFTTFSSFSLNTLNLIRDGEWGYAGLNMVGSVVLCMISVWLGAACATLLNQFKGA